MNYGFADIEGALAKMYGIADEKRTAFVGRLKHLQRQGYPPGTNTGRGRAASYGAHHAFLLAIVLQLSDFGLTPEKAVKLAQVSFGPLAKGVMATMTPTPFELKEAVYCHIPPAGLEDLATAKPSALGLVCSSSTQLEATFSAMADKPILQFRVCLFSLSGLVIGLPFYIRPEDGEHQREFWRALREWAEPIAEKFEAARPSWEAQRSADYVNP